MNPNWAKLRIWKTSQQDAFEELCCQLAHTEKVPFGSKFIRNAPPDAGVECFWILPDGSEWGWQAKFPSGGMAKSLWAELDVSVTTALSKCPKLSRYFVCLPISFSNARLKGQKSAREKWNKRVAKWTKLAAKKNRRVEFILWDEHELWMRLSHADHCGRRMFWFGDTVFDASWFRANVQASIDQAGDRYEIKYNRKPEPYTQIGPDFIRNRDDVNTACPAPILVANDEYLCEKGTHDCSVDESIPITLPCRWLVEKMKLKMRGRHGEFFDNAGTLIAFDPSMRERGPGALLVRKQQFLSFLRNHRYRMFWTLLGEKNIYAPGPVGGRDQWLGRLEINGAYALNKNQVYGDFRCKFVAGDNAKDSEF